MPLRVLIADDHALIGDSLELHLTKLQPGVEIVKALDLRQAETIARGPAALDLVFLDLHMPGMDGFGGLAKIRALQPAARIAIITGQATVETARAALAAGADGFVPKTAGAGLIVYAAQRMLAGEKFEPPDIYLRAAEPSADVATDARPLSGLTARETEVLLRLIDGRANKEIARDLGIELVTVSLHLKNIYRKLGVVNRTQAVKRGLEAGFGARSPLN